MSVQRYLKNSILKDALADGKMAFISRPRQVGKTHLAKQCLNASTNYFNWDATEFKRHWIRSPLKAIEEVDFCVVRDGKPWMLIECKFQSTTLSRPLKKFADRFPLASAFQLTTRNVDRVVPGANIRIINTEKFLSMLI